MNPFARRRLVDQAARWVISLGGVVIIVSILAMLVFLVAETIPLWGRARVDSREARPRSLVGTSGSAPALAANEYREIVFLVSGQGKGMALDGSSSEVLFEEELGSFAGRASTVATALDPGGLDWLHGTDDGALVRVSFGAGLRVGREGRSYSPTVVAGDPIEVAPGRPISLLGAIGIEGGLTCAAHVAGDSIVHVIRLTERTTPLGDVRVRRRAREITLPDGVSPSVLAVDEGGTHVFVGTPSGQLLLFDASTSTETPLGSYRVFPGSGISALGTLLGGHSLVIGGTGGEVEVWFLARPAGENDLQLVRAHVFELHDAPVVGVTASNRDKGFLTWDASGEARVHFSTTGETRVELALDGPGPYRFTMTPKADGILAANGDGDVRDWDLVNPHPEVTLRSLFGKVHYEGYPEPDYAWQSTGATDETEPKLSLIPLIFGTLKGTFYALVVSVPIAILAALYTALFMRPGIRNIVKPTMELMAAMPSVVLGLLAGLWLAPRLQDAMPIGLLAPILVIAVIVVAGRLWLFVPGQARAKVQPGVEAFLLVPLIIGVVLALVAFNPAVDGSFDGGFLNWLYTSFDIRYDQRNALIVGLAMGLAVIPIIFSISEDSLSSVPRHLTAGSLALGATPWQTAWRVVLPAASPGIFSAVMIGFGRAVGETMIVLMATGNTPIMDWSVFNGFRTLSANIAVEIPEAPHGGSLYRVLFLAALLLFAITFVVNTAAEIVSHRLRQRYSRF